MARPIVLDELNRFNTGSACRINKWLVFGESRLGGGRRHCLAISNATRGIQLLRKTGDQLRMFRVIDKILHRRRGLAVVIKFPRDDFPGFRLDPLVVSPAVGDSCNP